MNLLKKCHSKHCEESRIKILRSLRDLRMTKRVNFLESSIRQNPKISYRKMAQILDIADSAVKKHLKTLKNKTLLKRVGGTCGYWEIKES